MPPVDPEIQRLISRHLDGQLPPRQQADLYRHLLKNPQVRQTLEDYQANDRLAAHALAELWPAGQPPVLPMAALTSQPRVPSPRPFSVARLLAGVAAAAAIGLLVGTVWFTLPTHAPGSRPAAAPLAIAVHRAVNPAGPPAVVTNVDLDAAADSATVAPRADGSADVGFVGLVDERENRVYLLKVGQPVRLAAGQVGDF